MTRKDARKLVRNSGGNLCVRYVEHPETKRPLFAGDLVQIARRAPRLAAGVVGATISIASLTYAQGGSRTVLRTESPAIDLPENSNRKSEPVQGSSRIFGVVLDPAGAVIPGTSVELREADSDKVRIITSKNDGSFSFEGIPAGKYTLTGNAPGFRQFMVTNIEIGDGVRYERNLELSVGAVYITMGVVAITTSEESIETALGLAVEREDLTEVLELLAKGADPNENEGIGKTALLSAVEDGSIEIVRALLANRANVNSKDMIGRNVLFRIDEDTSVELVRILLAYGADINLRDEDGVTPLIFAAENGSAETLKLLIDAGADINAADDEGTTALMVAANDESLKKVKILLKAGANVHAKNKDDETAWDLTGEEEIEKLLESYGAIPTPEAPDRETSAETSDETSS